MIMITALTSYDDSDDHYDYRSGWMWSYFTNLKMSEKVGPLRKKLTKPSTIDVMIHCNQIWDSPLIRQQESQLFKTPHSWISMIKLWIVCTWFHLMKFFHAFKVHVDVCLRSQQETWPSLSGALDTWQAEFTLELLAKAWVFQTTNPGVLRYPFTPSVCWMIWMRKIESKPWHWHSVFSPSFPNRAPRTNTRIGAKGRTGLSMLSSNFTYIVHVQCILLLLVCVCDVYAPCW